MRGLCLTGGGSHGAFQVGALLALARSGWDWQRGAGVSVGAINIAKLVQYKIGEFEQGALELWRMWEALRDRDIKRSRSLGLFSLLVGAPSIYRTRTALGSLIRREYDPALARTSGRRASVGAVCWNSGDYVWRSQHAPNFEVWVEASASFPFFFEPVEIDGKLYTDGGVRNVAPLGELVRAGCKEIVLIACSNPDLPSPWEPGGSLKFVSYLARGLGLMSDEIARTDYQAVGIRNELAELTPSYRNVRVRIIEPPRPLDEADSLTFDQSAIRPWLKLGLGVGENCVRR
ncbi:MAG: patatin-like phospholipase family protein, partial [Dehalococcoidia bacterium]